MKRSAKVFIVCSPCARVGVTTTARLLTDYYLFTGARFEGFDTDPHESRYGMRFPGLVRTVDLYDIKGQIALFDRLLETDGSIKIVDLWHRSFERFFTTIRDIGFVEEARGRGIQPLLLFHPDEHDVTLADAQALLAAWPDLSMILVHNEGAYPLGDEATEILQRYPAKGKFVIPPLESPLAKVMENPSLSFSRFMRAPPAEMSIVVRAALKSWIGSVFTQFNSFELREELESSNYLR